MGEVYRARDTRLNRDVAIKVLPAIFAQDRDRLMRFEREAQLLAQLNHANIAAIYGLEEADAQRFLVLEYVPGDTLGQRITGRPLGLEDTLDITRQLIDALEDAHEKNIIHRDLKPANIKISPPAPASGTIFATSRRYLLRLFFRSATLRDRIHGH